MLYPRIVLSLLFVFVAAFSGTAVAAPQILALVASNGVATPMHCADGTCKAELSSFCLQQERATPLAGTTYHAMAPDALTLVVEKADGTVQRLPAGDRLRLAPERGSHVVDDGGVRIAAARETNWLINALEFSAEDAKSGAAWNKITAWKPGIRSGQYWANQRISHCQSKPAGPALGRCLRDWHDFLIRRLNTEYWDKARAGS